MKILIFQYTRHSRVLAPIYQQCGQRGQIQKSGRLGRRLTRAANAPVVKGSFIIIIISIDTFDLYNSLPYTHLLSFKYNIYLIKNKKKNKKIYVHLIII